jgi:hypothetical protein
VRQRGRRRRALGGVREQFKEKIRFRHAGAIP